MQYTPEILAQHLGKNYNPDAHYIIDTHRGASTRILSGRFKIIGEVPDFSLNEKGTMVVLEVMEPLPSDASGGAGRSSIAAPPNTGGGQRSVATRNERTLQSSGTGERSGVEPIVTPEPIKTEPVREPKPEPVKTTPKQAEPAVIPKSIHVKAPTPTATDRGGKPLGGKKK